ncbi:MAG: hypothetical protein GY941_19740 [Planctomycetes bacterium]|nr:hypothetical protein [Planctomycetota bacterium]
MINKGKTCSLDGCENPSHIKTMCVMHYQRWKRYGNPHDTSKTFRARIGHIAIPPQSGGGRETTKEDRARAFSTVVSGARWGVAAIT